MAIQAPGAEVTGATLQIFRSSGFAERGFCLECGSHVFHRPREGPELAISAGLFEPGGFHLAEEIFHDRKPPFYRFGDDTRKKGSLAMAAVWAPRLLWRRLMRTLSRTA